MLSQMYGEDLPEPVNEDHIKKYYIWGTPYKHLPQISLENGATNCLLFSIYKV